MGPEFPAFDTARGAEGVSRALRASPVPCEMLGLCRLTGPCEWKLRDASRLRSASVAVVSSIDTDSGSNTDVTGLSPGLALITKRRLIANKIHFRRKAFDHF